jgi:hypothetical protein
MNDERRGDTRRLVAGIHYQSRGGGRLAVGLVLLTLGFLWTLDNFNVLDASEVLRWWPAILIVVGALRLVSPGKMHKTFSGLLLLAAGTLLVLREANVIRLRFWDLWPVFLMLIGASVVLRSIRGHDSSAANPDGPDSSSWLNVFSIMGAVARKGVATDFRGGEVTAVMAGAEIDLRGARSTNGRVEVDVFTWWGGIDIMVPEDWEVVSEVTPIMGAFEDKTHLSKASPTTRLIVRGLVVMGGVEVKN